MSNKNKSSLISKMKVWILIFLIFLEEKNKNNLLI